MVAAGRMIRGRPNTSSQMPTMTQKDARLMLVSHPGDACRRVLDSYENDSHPAGPCLALLNREALTSRAREMGAPQVEFKTDAAPRMQTEPIRIISCWEELDTDRQAARVRTQPPSMTRNVLARISGPDGLSAVVRGERLAQLWRDAASRINTIGFLMFIPLAKDALFSLVRALKRINSKPGNFND